RGWSARPACRSTDWAGSTTKRPAVCGTRAWSVWRRLTGSELELGLQPDARLTLVWRHLLRSGLQLLVAQRHRPADPQRGRDVVVGAGFDVVPVGFPGVRLLQVERHPPAAAA